MSAEKVAAALKGVTVLAVGKVLEAEIEMEPSSLVNLNLKIIVRDASLDELREHIRNRRKIMIVSGE